MHVSQSIGKPAWFCLCVLKVGVVQYSDTPRLEIPLGQHQGEAKLLEAIQGIKYLGGNTQAGWHAFSLHLYRFTFACRSYESTSPLCIICKHWIYLHSFGESWVRNLNLSQQVHSFFLQCNSQKNNNSSWMLVNIPLGTCDVSQYPGGFHSL